MQVTVWPRGLSRTLDAPTSGAGSLNMTRLGELLEVNASSRYEPGFGGHDLASWTIKPFGGYAGGIVRAGDHCRIVQGGGTVWEGEFSEATPGEDGSVTFNARGYAYNLFDYLALKYDVVAGYYSTSDIGAAWDVAVTDFGIPITQVVVSGGVLTGTYGATDVAEGFGNLATLLTAVYQEQSLRWAVWGRTLVIAADPTTPVWRYPAPEAVVATADTDYATDVMLWYVKTDPPVVLSDWGMTTATDTLGLSRFDRRMVGVDYRSLGLMSGARASTIAQSLLDQVRGRFVYTGGFTVGPDSGFQSAAGGRVTQLAYVRAGQVVDVPGMRTSQGNLMPDGSNAFIIGKTNYQWTREGQESLQVAPMGAVARDLSSILAAPSADFGKGYLFG